MSFERHGYQFEGAFTSANQLEARAGVYVIWCKNGETWTCLDVGDLHNVQERGLNHDRADQWRRSCGGTIYYAAHYTPNLQQSGRGQIESRPICGER
ncbi:MAG: hypothetical protein ACRD1R_02725 [Acidobacteriota bacterium]